MMTRSTRRFAQRYPFARVGTGAHCATSLELTSISVEDLKRQVAGSLFKVAADGSLLLVPTRAATRVLRPSAAASGTPTGPPAPSASASERLEVHVRTTPVGRPVGHVVPGAFQTLEDLAATCSHVAWGVVLKVGTLPATISTTGDDLVNLLLTVAGNPQPKPNIYVRNDCAEAHRWAKRFSTILRVWRCYFMLVDCHTTRGFAIDASVLVRFYDDRANCGAFELRANCAVRFARSRC